MIKYDLHLLGWYDFQQLCLTIAREILGQTIMNFLDSNDAGKDGAFSGIWEQKDSDQLLVLSHGGCLAAIGFMAK